jgi:CRP/FNR family transcriptional regulator, anaerobic regulatory protein
MARDVGSRSDADHTWQPTDCLSCPIRRHAVYGPLPPAEVAEISRMRRAVRRVPGRRIVLREGEVPTELFTLVEGWAFRFKLLPDGRRQILSFLIPGDLVVFRGLFEAPLGFSVQSLTAVGLCVFPAGELAAFLQGRSRLAEELMRLCSREHGAADNRLTDLGRRSASERIGGFVLDLDTRLRARNLAHGPSLPFPLRLEHIADALGLSPIHVSRTLTRLRRDGLLAIDEGRLRIDDRARLTELAGLEEKPRD